MAIKINKDFIIAGVFDKKKTYITSGYLDLRNTPIAQDVAVFARNTTKIEGEYDPMQHRINARNILDNVWLWIAIIGMIICCVLVA